MGLGQGDEVLNTPQGDAKPNLMLKELPEQVIEGAKQDGKSGSSTTKKSTPAVDRKILGKRIRNVAEGNGGKKSGKSIIKIKSLNTDSAENALDYDQESVPIIMEDQHKSKVKKKKAKKIHMKIEKEM